MYCENAFFIALKQSFLHIVRVIPLIEFHCNHYWIHDVFLSWSNSTTNEWINDEFLLLFCLWSLGKFIFCTLLINKCGLYKNTFSLYVYDQLVVKKTISVSIVLRILNENGRICKQRGFLCIWLTLTYNGTTYMMMYMHWRFHMKILQNNSCMKIIKNINEHQRSQLCYIHKTLINNGYVRNETHKFNCIEKST